MTGALSMILIDETVVSVALPSIQRSLELSSTQLQWVVNAYLLTLAAFVALGGRLSDMIGRVPVFLIGVIVFISASATAGLSTEPVHILASRAVQGVGAAMMVPASQAIVTDAFPVEERGRAMGIYAGISMAFLALGPLIGGLLTEHVGWEWVFFVNLPVGLATIGLTLYSRPSTTRAPAGHFDATGSVLVVLGLSATVFAVMQSSAWGWSDPRVLGILAAGVLLLVVFVVVELRRAAPLVDLRIFRYGSFAGDALVLFLIQFGFMGIAVFGAIYAQDVLGFSPVEAGLALLPLTIPLLMLATFSGRLYDRIGARIPVAFGSAIVAAGFFATAALVLELDYWYLVPGYVALGIGIAFVMTPANTDGMNTAPPALRGAAAGLLQAVRQVGGTFGIAVLTSVIVSLTNRNLDRNLGDIVITGIKAKEVEGLLAERRSGTGEIPASVPRSALDQVVDAAKDAFSSSLRVAYIVLGAAMTLAVIAALFLVRKGAFAAQQPGVEPVSTHPLAAHATPPPVTVEA